MENNSDWTPGENKPNQSQLPAIDRKTGIGLPQESKNAEFG